MEINLNENNCRKCDTMHKVKLVKPQDLMQYKSENKAKVKEDDYVQVSREEQVSRAEQVDVINAYYIALDEALGRKSNYCIKSTSSEYFAKKDFNCDRGYRMDDEINKSVWGLSMLLGVFYFFYEFFYPVVHETFRPKN
jgi:hypothetical protein